MRKLKPSVKAAIASTLVITSTAAIAYAVPKLTNEKNARTRNQLKLDVERVDSDTVKVSIDNVQDIPKSIQFSIKLDGVSLKDGENSINDLVKKEVEKRLKNKEYSTKTNSILTDYTYNRSNNTIDVLITSENSLPKTGNKIEIFELDVKGDSVGSKTYKVVPNKEDEYKYVSNTNKEYNNLGVTHDNKDIAIDTAPTISSDERYINIVEGEKLELTPKVLEEKIGLKIDHEDGDKDLTLEVKKDNKVITEFAENTPGIYELEIRVVKDNTLKSDALTIQVNVALDNITEPPTITINGEELKDITIDGGSIFKPLEGVSATDKKGRDVKVEVKVDKSLDLDPKQDTTYTLTYTATDIYNNTATKEITLTVIANKAPVILGVKDHTISVGDKFDPTEGVTVNDEDKDIELKVDSNVNTNVAGEYKVLYSATDSKGKTSRAQSKVTVNPKSTVINKAPVITAEDKVIKVGDKFDPKAGVSAKDADGVDITSKIEVIENNVDTSKAGTYKVKYSVTDSKGVTTTKIITITVEKEIILAKSITINDKSDNKMYIDNTKVITASINKEAQIRDIEWTISDENIASLKVVDNQAQIVAKSQGKVTITASTTDGSGKSDSMTINIVNFKNDSNVPSYIRDIIDTDVLLPVVEKDSPTIVFEVKDITVNKLDAFLDKLEKQSIELVSLREENDFKIYTIKMTNKSGLFKFLNVNYLDIKVSNSLANASDINDRLNKLQDLKPVIEITSNQTITVGDSFNPLEGVIAYDKDGADITSNIKVEGSVDTSKAGDYKLTYTVKDAQGRETALTVVITVKEKVETPQKPPVEENKPETPEGPSIEDDKPETPEGPSVEENKPNTPQGPSEEENKPSTPEGPSEEENKPSTPEGPLVEENKPETPQEPSVKNNKPVIKVTSSIDTIIVGSDFNPLAGVSAYDKEDGDLTSAIKVLGSVDTSKAGEYKLIYTVEDKDGNISTFTRIVVVKEEDTLTSENNNAAETGDSSMLGYVGTFALSLGGLLFVRKNKKQK